MPGEQHKELPIEVVLRMLGEYSTKVATGLRRRWQYLVVLILIAMMAFGTGYLGMPSSIGGFSLLYGVLLVAIVLAAWARDRTELQLAVWQLRRIYELASRIEDVGTTIDFVHRFEFELRLSEALFLLNRAEGINSDKKGLFPPNHADRFIRRASGTDPEETLDDPLPADRLR